MNTKESWRTGINESNGETQKERGGWRGEKGEREEAKRKDTTQRIKQEETKERGEEELRKGAVLQ